MAMPIVTMSLPVNVFMTALVAKAFPMPKLMIGLISAMPFVGNFLQIFVAAFLVRWKPPKTLTAIAEGRVLFIGTANNTSSFTPELNRRFPDQFYFDLLDEVGRRAIWTVYVEKNGLTKQQAAFPPGMDLGWTGAEIQRVCERARLFKKTVPEAAQYLVPQAIAKHDEIKASRMAAAGKFLSATHEGPYRVPEEELPHIGFDRHVDLEEVR
jgi:hypothetical protein